jgi:hypothetical protein
MLVVKSDPPLLSRGKDCAQTCALLKLSSLNRTPLVVKSDPPFSDKSDPLLSLNATPPKPVRSCLYGLPIFFNR